MRGCPCEVTASRARKALDLERRGQRPEGPHEDHVPGLGYFGVNRRADAREVTERRSPPVNLSPA